MSYKSTQRWRYKAKIWLTEYMGGSCQGCGYNAYPGNLTCHHLGNKVETLSKMINRCASWEDILNEAKKCVLVCHNCHGEIHGGLRKEPPIQADKRQTRLMELEATRPQPKPKPFCKCGRQVNEYRNKFCSEECSAKNNEKIEWPENLRELVAASSKLAVAKRLGVSDKAVDKRLKNH